MAAPGRVRIAVRISQDVWLEEVERFSPSSPARTAAERERSKLESEGLELGHLQACEEAAADGTNLAGLYKVYVPIGDGPPSLRPYAFVFLPARSGSDVFLRLIAFGERHPDRRSRSVYERAHKRQHGRYPRQ